MMQRVAGWRFYWETRGGRFAIGLSQQTWYVGLLIYERGVWSLSLLPGTTIGYETRAAAARNAVASLRNPDCNCEQCREHRRLAILTATPTTA